MCEGKMHKWNRNFKVGHDSFGWEVLGHYPYSLDLTPSDFHLFCYLKHDLGGNHYNNNEVPKTALTSWLSEQAASSFKKIFKIQLEGIYACLNKYGSYIKNRELYVEYENKFGF